MTATAGRRIDVTGTVQGVGFRPFVWRLATDLGLAGTVRNLGGRVEIEAYGPDDALDRLVIALRAQAPARAQVESVTAVPLTIVQPLVGFSVVDSGLERESVRLFPADLATCAACVAELFDPNDRRYRYPFINCTDCGPRATIIDSLPYDRSRTTMADFALCQPCRAEYENPADRRFHAEPIACPDCGPQLRWDDTRGEEALRHAVGALVDGAIVAVKGLGGYHLACDATNPVVVERLRERKRRWAKPFAVMVAQLERARELAELSPAQEALLQDPASPIVLATAKGTEQLLADGVAPGQRDLGVFLPYTGLHHLLLRGVGRPIVLTSGNRADEPIAVDDDDARQRLRGIADGFLSHNRRIRSRYEDSVAQVHSTGIGTRGSALLRRARGYAPQPLTLPIAAPEPILAVGAQLKHTFTIAIGSRAYVGPHTGDLEEWAAYEAFQANLAHLTEILEATPVRVAHDAHPAYLSTQFAEATGQATEVVQHHHAHVASCLAEHGLTGPVVGVALDGLGWGDDGTFWGGEILIADLTAYERVGRFGRAPMPGGAAAVREPWRMALGYLFGSEEFGSAEFASAEFGSAEFGSANGGGAEFGGGPIAAPDFLASLDPTAVAAIRQQIERGVNCPQASSAGRLFDAASALLGLRLMNAYEAEAAIALEHIAHEGELGHLPAPIVTKDGLAVYNPAPTLAALIAGRAEGEPVPVLAAKFQQTIATVVAQLASDAAETANLDTVCLSGGVFANRRLVADLDRRLTEAGLIAYFNQQIPAGDGGISFGQAAIAAARATNRETSRTAARKNATS